MDTDTLTALIVDALANIKGRDIMVYDTAGKTSAFERVVIVTAGSGRQARALADSAVQAVKEAGGTVRGVEGQDTGHWVLVDCGSVIVHCMERAARDYYDLAELWGPEPMARFLPAS